MSGEKAAEPVELGYLDKVPEWKLHHRYFPSKVGGFPAWLDLNSLPYPQNLQCPSCGEPASFLLQMYAEEDARDPSGGSFHRTVFVFACRKSACMKPGLSKSVIVLRCGLSRVNETYSDTPAAEDPEATAPEIKNPLCAVCGCLAPNTCSACKKMFYCGKSHQMFAWANGHKQECAKIKDDASVSRGERMKAHSVVFAEYELYAETEELEPSGTHKSDAQNNAEYENTMGKLQPELNEVAADDLEAFCSNAKDKTFLQFQKRVNLNPEQVLRYDRGGKPLLISGKSVPDERSIPKCQCGSKRKFEFQIMPQILNHLEQEETLQEGLDFGTILVYTCPKNCHVGPKYAPEVAWVQVVESGGDGGIGADDDDDDSE